MGIERGRGQRRPKERDPRSERVIINSDKEGVESTRTERQQKR